MKKKDYLLIILLLLVGITGIYVGSTYAKYVEQLDEKTGEAVIAKWNFSGDNENVSMDIDFTNTYDPDTLVAKRIAPGTEGEFSIELFNTSSEVGVDYEIAFGTPTGKAASLTFYDEHDQEIDITSDTLTGFIPVGESDTITIKWAWAYDVSAEQDAADTALGTAGGADGTKLSIPITITGTQTQPVEQ